MFDPLLVLDFEACKVRLLDDGAETVFKVDGAVARAHVPWGDIDHIAASWTAGYGGDQLRMVQEHEAAHAFIAQALNASRSASVWAAAHGAGDRTAIGSWPQHIKDEEHLVVSFQRFVNAGVRDPYDRLGHAFGDRLSGAANRFVRLVRPWLFA